MLLKSVHLVLFVLLPVSYAHGIVSPPLGVNGTPKRSDVKRPSDNEPCGAGVDIQSSLDTSTAVPPGVNGDVKVTVTSFNPGGDGSRQVTAKVDPTGTGKSFVEMTVTVNGDPAPQAAGSQDVVAQIPAGTTCTGGSKKNTCLVQFITSSGFGNCVAVSQGSNNSKSSSIVRTSSPNGAAPSTPVEKKGNGEQGKKDGKKGKKKGKKGGKKVAAGEKNKGKGSKKVGASKNDGDGGKKKQNKVAAETKSKPQDDNVADGTTKTDGDTKQAGTRAARALLANLDHDARGADSSSR